MPAIKKIGYFTRWFPPGNGANSVPPKAGVSKPETVTEPHPGATVTEVTVTLEFGSSIPISVVAAKE
jgi:hypothetical protein